MTANHDLDRRLAGYYASRPPLRAPDWVLQGALSTIETTPQRRGLAALRRYPTLPTYTKLAAAAVLVVAVGGFALWQLASPGPGGRPTPAASPTVAPSPTAPSTARPGPTAYVTPALTGTFTSDLHGISLSYPEGWATRAATQPWTEGDPPLFGQPAGDFVYDPVLEDHLFIGVASQPLGDTPFAEWLRDFLAAEGCANTEAIVVDGADGVIGVECQLALVSIAGRGYVFAVNASSDDPELRDLDARGLLEDVLATVQLLPDDAVDQ